MLHFLFISIHSHSCIIFHSFTDFSIWMLTLHINLSSTTLETRDHYNNLYILVYQSNLVLLRNLGVVCGNQISITMKFHNHNSSNLIISHYIQSYLFHSKYRSLFLITFLMFQLPFHSYPLLDSMTMVASKSTHSII